jgi:hypothetical protein
LIKIFKWLFIESSARWLFYILGAEYVIATNLSPTILTDYPILNNLVESMAFIPAVHNFDKIATHPEAVRFYIALAILLVIPKSFAVYDWLKKNPNMWMRQFIITPLTTSKPTSAQLATRLSKTEEEIAQMPTEPRSRASAIFWSLMILGFAAVAIGMLFMEGFSKTSAFLQEDYKKIGMGGFSIWYEFSLRNATFTSLLLAISTVVIKDSITYFKSFSVF